jgi:hypothetical protein
LNAGDKNFRQQTLLSGFQIWLLLTSDWASPPSCELLAYIKMVEVSYMWKLVTK